jgi:hypothetical protein
MLMKGKYKMENRFLILEFTKAYDFF